MLPIFILKSLSPTKELQTNRNGNSTNFFSYVCNGKKIKELFASTLIGMTASVRCVPSIIVVLNAKLTRLIAALANKNDRNAKVRQECRFLLVETHKHLTSIAVLTEHAKHPKTQQICHYKHTRKTSELFLLFNTRVDFSLCNNFSNSGSFAKVSVPVHIYNFLLLLCRIEELSSCLLIMRTQFIIVHHCLQGIMD